VPGKKVDPDEEEQPIVGFKGRKTHAHELEKEKEKEDLSGHHRKKRQDSDEDAVEKDGESNDPNQMPLKNPLSTNENGESLENVRKN